MEPTAPSTQETVDAASGGAPGSTSADFERGALVGRYVVLSKLGAGAMGVVLAAYDPELDRKVALKILKGRDGDREAARIRLQREAQALAKLSHSNVVSVHDVGLHSGQVFIAMEFVDGETLGAWMQRRHPWREVLAVFEAAGRGLAAAHAQGLVHRDFKPDNVMIGGDGRVRVMDFGLATVGRAGRDGADSADGVELPAEREDSFGTQLTRTGALLGTPAYMAPEQFAGLEATEKSDQFAYSAALFEALYHQRPFPGKTVAQLGLAVSEGRLAAVDRKMAPKWLHAIVARGLSAKPEDRFASVQVLLSALGRGEAIRRRRWFATGLASFGLVGAGVFGYGQREHSQRVDACTDSGALIAQDWNPDVSAEIRNAFVATGAASAEDTAARVAKWFDAYAESWREHRTQACLNANVDATWTEERRDRAVWCLEEQRSELKALLAAFREADATVMTRAVSAAAGLGPVSPCTDETVLAGLGDPPAPDLRPRVEEARAGVSSALALEGAGNYEEGLKAAVKAREHATTLDWQPLVAAAGALEARILARLGDYQAAEKRGVDAYMLAARLQRWATAHQAAIQLAYVLGSRQTRHDEGELWIRHAEVAITHAGDPLGQREASRIATLGAIRANRSDHASAKALYEQAILLHEAALGPDHPGLSVVIGNLGNAHRGLGDYEAAKLHHERALAVLEGALGPEHPEVAEHRLNLGMINHTLGNHTQAKAHAEAALAVFERVMGPDHPHCTLALNNLALAEVGLGNFDAAKGLYATAIEQAERSVGSDHLDVAAALTNLGALHSTLGEHELAKAAFERATEIGERSLEPGHPDLVAALNNLGSAHHSLGEYDEARRLYERVVKLREKHQGPEHPEYAVSLLNLGLLESETGDPKRGLESLEKALAILESALGPDHLHVSYALIGAGEAHLALAHPGEAIELLERGLKIRMASSASPIALAEARFSLARALWSAPAEEGRDHDRARRLAAESRDGYATLGSSGENARAEVEEWLGQHPARG